MKFTLMTAIVLLPTLFTPVLAQNLQPKDAICTGERDSVLLTDVQNIEVRILDTALRRHYAKSNGKSVTCELTLDPHGQVIDLKVLKSANDIGVDRDALDLIEQAAPFGLLGKDGAQRPIQVKFVDFGNFENSLYYTSSRNHSKSQFKFGENGVVVSYPQTVGAHRDKK